MIEAKVAAPAAGGAVVAALALAAAFGIHLNETQQAAILAGVVAALPLVHFLLGYLAPHTSRPLNPGAPVVVAALPEEFIAQPVAAPVAPVDPLLDY